MVRDMMESKTAQPAVYENEKSDFTGIDRTSAQVSLDKLCAWFGRTQVLYDITFAVAPAKVTAVIGPSGCGKSTCIRIINRMHEMTPGARVGGSVTFEGLNIYSPAVNPVVEGMMREAAVMVREVMARFVRVREEPTLQIHNTTNKGTTVWQTGS